MIQIDLGMRMLVKQDDAERIDALLDKVDDMIERYERTYVDSPSFERALAGSPAANKEPASAPWEGLEGWNVGVEFRGDDVVVMARAPGQSVWRDLLAVTR